MQEQADAELDLPSVDPHLPLGSCVDGGSHAQQGRHGDILIVQRVRDAGAAAARRAAAASNGDGGVAAAAVAAGMNASALAQEEQPPLPPVSALSHYRTGTFATFARCK